MIQKNSNLFRDYFRIKHVLGLGVMLGILAFALAVMYQLGIYVPASIATALILSIWGFVLIWIFAMSRAYLMRYILLFYGFPFILCRGYIFCDDYIWWPNECDLSYMSNPRVMADMTSVGLIGLLGILSGSLVIWGWQKNTSDTTISSGKRLPVLPFLLLLGVVATIAYFSSSEGTIFDEDYYHLHPRGGSIMNGLYAIGYVLWLVLYVDAQFDASTRRRRIKILLCVFVLAYIFIYAQLLRGDRECIGLIIAFVVLTLLSPSPSPRSLRREIVRHALAVLLILGVGFVMLMLQTVRNGQLTDTKSIPVTPTQSCTVSHQSTKPATDSDMSRASQCFEKAKLSEGLRYSPWGMVLLTNYWTAVMHYQGDAPLYYGQTYWDMALSLPPSFVASRLGYIRPLDKKNIIHWFVPVHGNSAGGGHIVTVPYMNFRIWGVLVYMFLIGMGSAYVERKTLAGHGWKMRSFYAMIFVAVPTWFWYFDMVFIRFVMAWCGVALLYWFCNRWIRPSLPWIDSLPKKES